MRSTLSVTCLFQRLKWPTTLSLNNDTPSESPQQLLARRAKSEAPFYTEHRQAAPLRRQRAAADRNTGSRDHSVMPAVWEALSLRPAFPVAVVSLSTATTPQARRRRRIKIIVFSGLHSPEHNCFHSIPPPGTGSGSFPPGLFYRPGFPPLTAFVALPSYIPLHCSPARLFFFFQWGEAVMLCCVAEKGAPPSGIVAPPASDSQHPVTKRHYAVNGRRSLALKPNVRRS